MHTKHYYFLISIPNSYEKIVDRVLKLQDLQQMVFQNLSVFTQHTSKFTS